MRKDPDPFSGRPLAAEALAALTPFREAGSRGFHTYPVPELRAAYEASCAANSVSPDELASITDFTLDGFRVRLYRAEGSDASGPAIIFFHGGGWVMGSLETHDSTARRIASLTRFPLLAVDYRLAPEHPYPAAINDCRAALKWLLESDEHGLSMSSVTLMGDSAGAQLAAVLTNESAGVLGIPIDAQVLLYPVTDLSADDTASSARIQQGFPLVAETMRWFADCYVPEGVDRTAADLSPLKTKLPEGLPPSFVLTVDHDPLADEGIAYAAALSRSGASVNHRHLSGYSHGLFTSAGKIREGEIQLASAAEFITQAANLREG